MYIDMIKHVYDGFMLDIAKIDLPENKIIGLVGENRAGKTTMMTILSGFLKSNTAFEVSDYNMAKILFVPSALKLYEYLTVSEFVRLGLQQATKQVDMQLILEKLQIINKKDTLIDDLSQGMQKKLALLNVFTKKYKLLILDEPFSSIDAQYIYKMKCELREIANNATVIISSHILDTLSNLCDEFIYLFI